MPHHDPRSVRHHSRALLSKDFYPLTAALTLWSAMGTVGAQVPPPQGLSGWWDADRTSTFDPNLGAHLLNMSDMSACAARATYVPVQAVPKAPGKVGEAIVCANGGYVLVDGAAPGGNAVFDGVAGFTIEFWMRDQGTPQGPLVTVIDKSHDCSSGWAFQGDGTDLGFFVVTPALGACPSVGFGTGNVPAQDKPFDGDWHHLAGVYDPSPANPGEHVQLFYDGVLLGTGDAQNAPIGTNTGSLVFGRSALFGRHFTGLLDEVTYYDRPLLAAEIHDIYTAGEFGKAKPHLGARIEEDTLVPTPAQPQTLFFAYSTVSADGDVIAAGAPGAADALGTRGLVTVFEPDAASGAWALESVLSGSAPALAQGFGEAVVVQAGEILVGEGNTSAVWMFEKVLGAWTGTPAFQVNGARAYGDFAQRIDRSGEHVIVGMPRQGSPPFPLDVGGVEFFERVAGTWHSRGTFAETSENGAYFGAAVAIEGEFALVGAPLLDDGGQDAGGAWVYRRTGNVWSLETQLRPEDTTTMPPVQIPPQPGSEFGAAVAISRDSDNRLVALVGAGRTDKCSSSPFTNTGREGAVYVFVRDGQTGQWSQEAVLRAPDAERDYFFGGIWDPTYRHGYDSLALEGDVALIGALGARPVIMASQHEGSVYAFRRFGTEWVETNRYFASTRTIGSRLGLGVALTDSHAMAIDASTAANPAIYLFDRPEATPRVVVRDAVPSNPGTLDVGPDGGPALGRTFRPRIPPFQQGTVVDALVVTAPTTVQLPAPPPAVGQALVDLSQVFQIEFVLAGQPFTVPIPNRTLFLGMRFSCQGASMNPRQVDLTNALDCEIGRR